MRRRMRLLSFYAALLLVLYSFTFVYARSSYPSSSSNHPHRISNTLPTHGDGSLVDNWINFAWKVWSRPIVDQKENSQKTHERKHHHAHEDTFLSRSETHAHSSGKKASVSRRTSSKVAVNNPAPGYVPPARIVAPLTVVGEFDSHWAITVTLGRGNSSSDELLPGAESSQIKLILDLGSGDLVLFNKTTCIFSDPNCFNHLRAPSFQVIPNPPHEKDIPSGFGVVLDGEAYGTEATIGKDLITFGANLIGTNQMEYTISTVEMWLSSPGTIVYAYPNKKNVQELNTATRSLQWLTLINAGYYDGSDGVLGMTYASASNIRKALGSSLSAWEVLSGGSANPFFSLDLTDGELFLGGIEEEWREKLLWSDGHLSDQDIGGFEGYHNFRLYHMKLCGVDLFQNLTTSWHGLIDTGASCLGLPAEFYDMIISWLPLKCELGASDGLPLLCYLDVQDVSSFSLPTVSFKLSDEGEDLFISLTDLLWPDGLLARLCIQRSDTLKGGPTAGNRISFGTRVISQFYAAFDMSMGLVGLANKASSIQESKVQCTSRVLCRGMEVHYDPLNICLPPPCADYYFFVNDDETKACKLSAGFHILCGIVIGIFILAELGLNEAVIYLSNKVQQNGIVAGN